MTSHRAAGTHSIVLRRLAASAVDLGLLALLGAAVAVHGAERCTGFLEDPSVFAACNATMSITLGTAVYGIPGSTLSAMFWLWLLELVVLAMLTARTGATPGKWLLGVRVRSLGGGRPSRRQALKRTAMGVLVDSAPYVLPVSGVLHLRGSGGRQRHGDVSAGTEVVRHAAATTRGVTPTSTEPSGR